MRSLLRQVRYVWLSITIDIVHLPPSSHVQLLTPMIPDYTVWRSVSTSPSWRVEMMTVAAPQFAESVSEGDVRWDKGTHLQLRMSVLTTSVNRSL